MWPEHCKIIFQNVSIFHWKTVKKKERKQKTKKKITLSKGSIFDMTL